MEALDRLDRIKDRFEEEIKKCGDLSRLDGVRTAYLGRKGELTMILRSLSALPDGQKVEVAKQANLLKREFTARIEETRAGLEETEAATKKDKTDVTLPGIRPRAGTVHPITGTISRINEIFISLGFSIAEGPEIETEFYNFGALNIPLEHPSRDAFDTFYIKGEYLLRSHTSNVQVHVMERQKPPVQVIMPGRVYRPDAVDASHSFMFHQVEGLMVDKGVSFSDLKGVLSIFCRSMFGNDIKMRLRPHFFPFTEPSAEVDISCIICEGKGCRVCSGNGWLEILGAGLVNPKVFEAVGYDPSEYSGYAFGMGVERIAMLLYGVEDIRLFFENDIRFLRQLS
ncbi:MAG: phenylalanine--tRNA ligase subunit alpha [Candidatus Omnitrophica bacterium]|nr:phenylalanine--tRNA ligase subunit alpha [Candidatus Omnitrophota bacterium]